MYGKQRLSHFTALLAVTMVAACGGGERFRLRGRSRPTSSTVTSSEIRLRILNKP